VWTVAGLLGPSPPSTVLASIEVKVCLYGYRSVCRWYAEVLTL
jgi:hypothetical protein